MTIPAEFVALAEKLADAARPIIRRYFRVPVAVDDKDDASPVTIADREAEAAMREIIKRTYPNHGILGEEYGETRPFPYFCAFEDQGLVEAVRRGRGESAVSVVPIDSAGPGRSTLASWCRWTGRITTGVNGDANGRC